MKKRPLKWKERGWRLAFFGIVAFDLILALFVASILIYLFEPHTYSAAPTICFNAPDSKPGSCDIETFAQVYTTTMFGDDFYTDTLVSLKIDAFVFNPNFNQSGDTIYFGFPPVGIWTGNDTSPCSTYVPPTLGTAINIPVSSVPSPNGAEHLFGTGETCFLYSGTFTPELAVVSAKNTTYLQEAPDQNFALVVQPPGSFFNANLQSGELFFAAAIVIFATVETFSFLTEIQGKAFPRRIEYGGQPGDYEKERAKLEEKSIDAGKWKDRESVEKKTEGKNPKTSEKNVDSSEEH